MCGFLAIANRQTPVDRNVVLAGRDALRHRGPDDAGLWMSPDECVGLGHRRLAILDLSPQGHQPMVSQCGAAVIVFNGEIYNCRELRTELHRHGRQFRGGSDTEVILAAYLEWGTACLERLAGMFAFAVYDTRSRTLFLARDRAGEKPLFYLESGEGFRCASELKAILSDPSVTRHLDAESLGCYLELGFVPGDRCILRGMRKLPPAHAMTYRCENGTTRIWRYWAAPQLDDDLSASEDQLVEELESLLYNAVSSQLVADVPVGVLLSGGADSSLITAMAVRRRPGILTFTVRFPDSAHLDETEHARLIARHFETNHVELEASAPEPELLSELANQFDEPIIDSSMVPTVLVSRLVREQCTVALGGDGGDELFGGYQHYSRLLWLEEQARMVPGSVRRVLGSSAGRLLPLGTKGRNWLKALGSDFRRGALPLIAEYFDRRTRRSLFLSRMDGLDSVEQIRLNRVPTESDLLQRATRMDFENYLAEDILVKVDRASMLMSLEIRAPMLDHKVLEFAFGRIPSSLKATPHERKILLGKLCGRILPPAFQRRRKQGFSIPLAEWLQRPKWRDFFEDVLLDEYSPFNKQYVGALLKAQSAGLSNGERLFGLVLFELWRHSYDISMN